jgi:Trk K+ transport system NAD-binding subunit
LLGEFRWTLLILATAVALSTLLHWLTRQPLPGGQRPSLGISVYAAWMSLFAQPLYSPPTRWYLLLLYAIYPVLGFILIGEGVVRLSLLMISKRRGEKEWMLVTASTYRDHVVLCGLGHLGFRVLEQLVHSNTPVVVLERSASNPFIVQAKALDVPVLVRDMKEDQALIDAGIKDASAIIIASNDDISNLEVAIDSRRMNPKVRIVMRLFDQQLASKIAGALTVDAAFSSSALTAPVVAAMSLQSTVLSSLTIAGESYVVVEIVVAESSRLISTTVHELEQEFGSRVLAITLKTGPTQPNPEGSAIISAGDKLVIHIAAKSLSTLAAAGCRSRK